MENSMRYAVVIVIAIAALVAVGFLVSDDTATRITPITPRAIAPISNVIKVTLENIDSDQILSPGVYVIHDDSVSLDFRGQMAPEALEPLVEYGDHNAFLDYVRGLDGIIAVYTVNEPIFPGQQTSFEVDLSGLSGPLYLSGIQMVVGSNDGYALLDDELILVNGGRARDFIALTDNYDAGTEENRELLTGFQGGQPDPAYGELNTRNGVPTQNAVDKHVQLITPVLRVGADVK